MSRSSLLPVTVSLTLIVIPAAALIWMRVSTDDRLAD